MFRKLTLMIFITICLSIITAAAQTNASDEKQAVIKQLVTMLTGEGKADDMIKRMIPVMQASQTQILKQTLAEHKELNAAQQKRMETAMLAYSNATSQRLIDIFTKKINYNETLDQITAEVYDKFYTLEELKDMVAFYQTPTGQKVLQTMTPLALETMRLSQERLTPKLLEALKETSAQDRAEMDRIFKSAIQNQ